MFPLLLLTHAPNVACASIPTEAGTIITTGISMQVNICATL